MIRLVVIRHAKSSWKDRQLRDRDRPLNKRGKSDLLAIGAVIAQTLPGPDIVLASPAKRTRQTVKGIQSQADFASAVVRYVERIYDAGYRDLLDLLSELRDGEKTVYLVGHNPAVTDLVNFVGDVELSNLPTCGVACILFSRESWKILQQGEGKLCWYDIPKNHAQT